MLQLPGEGVAGGRAGLPRPAVRGPDDHAAPIIGNSFNSFIIKRLVSQCFLVPGVPDPPERGVAGVLPGLHAAAGLLQAQRHLPQLAKYQEVTGDTTEECPVTERDA